MLLQPPCSTLFPYTTLFRSRSYVAEIYADGPNAHWLDNPLPVTISRQTVTSASRLRLALAPGGGQAIRLRSEEHTSELQSRLHLVCRLLLEKKKSFPRPSSS